MGRILIKGGKIPIRPLPTHYYVKCGSCDRVEGQFVESNNQLTVGTGVWASQYQARGWAYANGAWRCPAC